MWDENGLKIEHADQAILESDPYRRLAFTVHTFVPELKSVVPALSEHVRTNGRPTAQWSRLEAGRSDDLGAAGR